MGFDGSFGNIQIVRNLRVVATLEKKLDNLLLPVPHSADLLFHELHLTGGARPAARAQGQHCVSVAHAKNSGLVSP